VIAPNALLVDVKFFVRKNPEWLPLLNFPGGNVNTHDCSDGSGLVRADDSSSSWRKQISLLYERQNLKHNRSRSWVRRKARCNQFVIGNVNASKLACWNPQRVCARPGAKWSGVFRHDDDPAFIDSVLPLPLTLKA
jgi:hypothetical protein